MSGEDLIRDAIEKKPYLNDMADGVIIKGGKEEKSNKKKYVKKIRKLPEAIEKWTPAHFVTFSCNLFNERYGKTWTLNFAAQCPEILKVKDSLVDIFGFCDNAILKEYIEWFFLHKSDFFFERSDGFYFSNLCKDKVRSAFSVDYKFTHPEKEYDNEEEYDSIDTKPKQEDEAKNTFLDMENVFLLDDENFVVRFGVIIAVNWLIDNRRFSAKEAIHYVYLACNKIYEKGTFDKVVESTVRYSPYPGRLRFLDADIMAKKVDPSLSICIEITLDARTDLPV